MKLRIADNLTLPLDAVTQTFGVLAKRGVGKTYTAAVFVEELLKADRQVVVVDPIGVWFGLRSSADGKHAGLPIIVMGGDHGDVPLEVTAGSTIADFITEQKASVVLDLSRFRKGEQTRFMTDFAETLYHRNRDPLMIVVDEADAFAPQRPQKGEERLLGAMEDLVRRGRARGLGIMLVTQRAAVLNKNVLTQVEVLVVLRTIAPQDREAIDAWVKVYGTDEQRDELMSSIASLAIGEAWFWSPGWLDTFKRVQVRRRETFDSSATPKQGETRKAPKKLADVDLEALKGRISATIEKAKLEDPKLLRGEISRLNEQVKRLTGELEKARHQTASGKPSAVLTDADRELLKTVGEEFREFVDAIANKADTMLFSLAERAKVEIDRASAVWVENVEKRRALFLDRLNQVRVQKVLTKLESVETPAPTQRSATRVTAHVAPTAPPATRRALTQLAKHVAKMPADALGAGERKILTAVAQANERGATREQLTVVTGYKRSSRDTYLQRLSQRGFINIVGDRIFPGVEGLAVLGADFEPLPEGDALRAYWLERLPEGERKVLEVITSHYPQVVAREDIDEATGYKRSSRDTYLQRLAARQLIVSDGRGTVRAVNELFS